MADAPDITNDSSGGENYAQEFADASYSMARKITKEGAMENQPAFKKALDSAWSKTRQAGQRGIAEENAFAVNRRGEIGDQQRHDTTPGDANADVTEHYDDDTAALIHTHPDSVSGRPSAADIAAAKRIKRPVMVKSKDGLFEIDATGKVTQTE